MRRKTGFLALGYPLATLFVIAGVVFAGGDVPTHTILLSEDFDGSFPPEGWITTSRSGCRWTRKSPGHDSQHSAGVTASTDREDSWLITPGLTLREGVEYTVGYWRKSTDFGSDDARYRLRLGTSQNPDKLSFPIASSSFVSRRWTRHAHTFIPPATATYYLGFHCTSSDWQSNGLFIDRVQVSR